MLRAHLMKAWRGSGRRPGALDTPPAPDGLAYLMGWFSELSARRQYFMGAPMAVAWGDIQAWAHMLARRVAPWQVQALCRLDDLWREAYARGREKAEPSTPPRRRRTGFAR